MSELTFKVRYVDESAYTIISIEYEYKEDLEFCKKLVSDFWDAIDKVAYRTIYRVEYRDKDDDFIILMRADTVKSPAKAYKLHFKHMSEMDGRCRVLIYR